MKTLSDLHTFSQRLPASEGPMPLLFVGHGNPMNAIEDNEFSRGWRAVGERLPAPAAILCISAHWETHGTYVTAMERPRTIHDFAGFPRELSEVHYPAPGSPALASQSKELLRKALVELDQAWGLDHGCWSVARHLYPSADVPVVQLSLDRSKPARWHYELAGDLEKLRTRGVLIIGSGNMVHNLRLMDWEQPAEGYDWARDANARFKGLIAGGDHEALVNYSALGQAAALSIPTPEHYLPMLYILGLRKQGEEAAFFNDRTVMGSIAMTSFILS
jgi:4,5-DOPA dioxygenase extradiol